MVVSNIEPTIPGKLENSTGFEVGRFGLADAHRKIQQIISYMGAHLSEPTQVNRLAAMANISPSHFYALFKQHTGYAPIDFFIRLRMRRASEILETTCLSVKEVAGMLGYEDQFYFSRMFKAVHGIPPREFRSRKEKSNHHDLKFAPPHLLRLISAVEKQKSERSLGGGYQPTAQRAKVFQERCRGFSAMPEQACPVPV